MTLDAACCGRFAPSPSGALHFGSLLAAVASYVDARHRGGRWLVRIEDIDPPREMPGASQSILQTLEAHGLQPDPWRADEPVMFQSHRHAAYRAALADLASRGLTYRCTCSRARLAALGYRYDGHCYRHPPAVGDDEPAAVRLRVDAAQAEICFDDRIQGRLCSNLLQDSGDFVIHRKDGLFAYQLAVVVDDMAQGITDVVRGSDILESTARQIYLCRLLGGQPPTYAHIPVALDLEGRKLSKQNHAPALDAGRATDNVWQALAMLGQQPDPDLRAGSVSALLHWAVVHWQIAAVPHSLAMAVAG